MDRRTFMGTFAALSAQGLPPFGVNGSGPNLFRYPYIQNTTTNGSTILWATEESGTASVELSSDGRNFSQVLASSQRFSREETRLLRPFILHRATIQGLSANTRYFYRVNLDGSHLAQGRFRTAGPGPFTFNLIGDSGQSTPAQKRVARRLAAERNSSFLVHAGDLAYFHGSHLEFQQNHFDNYNFLLSTVPFFPVPGNHDYETEDARPYLSTHALPPGTVPVPDGDAGRYYSLDWGSAHFVFLDSNLPLQRAAKGEGRMLEWLQNDLTQTAQPWRIAVIHHSPYGTGLNEGDPLSALVRQHVAPVLEANSVQLVLSGHEHSYQRSYPLRSGALADPGKGTIYVTAGGGGAFLYPLFPSPLIAFGKSQHHFLRVEVSASSVGVTAVGEDGTKIDSFVLN